MVLAFLFGWVGLERAMVAYSFGAVVTVSVVVANTGQAGFSLGLIMTRLNSAVIGTVIGQAVQQVLAVQTVLWSVKVMVVCRYFLQAVSSVFVSFFGGEFVKAFKAR